MDTQTARNIISALQKKHKAFHLLEFQAHQDGMFMTFEQIDIDLKTISSWISDTGAYALYVGIEGTGDRRVFCAEVRL